MIGIKKKTQKNTVDAVRRNNKSFVDKIRYVQDAIKHDIKTKNMNAVAKSLLNMRLLDLDLAIAKSFMKNKDALKTSLLNSHYETLALSKG